MRVSKLNWYTPHAKGITNLLCRCSGDRVFSLDRKGTLSGNPETPQAVDNLRATRVVRN